MIYSHLTQLNGRYKPLYLRGFSNKSKVFALFEAQSIGRSVKDRLAIEIVQHFKANPLPEGKTLLVPTMGNLAISLILMSWHEHFPVKFVIPNKTLPERKQILERFSPKNILWQDCDNLIDTLSAAKKIASEDESYYFLDLYDFSKHMDLKQKIASRWYSDYHHFFQSIQGKAAFVSGIGTGISLMGLGQLLFQRHEMQLFAVKAPGVIGIDTKLMRPLPEPIKVIEVEQQKAIVEMEELGQSHGYLAGISTGANLAAVRSLLDNNNFDVIVTLFCDSGERYFSVN